MSISVFDLFTIGIGPSSSHTVGPMRAAQQFVETLKQQQLLPYTHSLTVSLYGSLSATGIGHGTDKAVLAGLTGHAPESVQPEIIEQLVADITAQSQLSLAGEHSVRFLPDQHLLFIDEALEAHPNGLRFIAKDGSDDTLLEKTYFSIGGGFIRDQENRDQSPAEGETVPFPFNSAEQLLQLCAEHNLKISELMLANEQHWHSQHEIWDGLLLRWQVMQQVVDKGIREEGVLPGGLGVRRRAPTLLKKLQGNLEPNLITRSLEAMDWVNLYALATNEENAAGGRIVTAPTNGAAGIIPAVLHYVSRYQEALVEEDIVSFFLTAGAIALLCKQNASISGAEVGCQGEVGSAAAMAAAGLAEILGGSPEQVENAAEIALEHNLGLTCDPVGGLVQVPCIERNAIAAVKAINAAQIALRGDGKHFVSLDKVIKTMKETGADMQDKYKETAKGGLAVNVVEC